MQDTATQRVFQLGL